MIQNKLEKRDVEVVSDVICNLCGKTCNAAKGQEETPSYEFATISASWGYFSTHDMDVHEAHVCNLCYDSVLTPLFKLSPLKKSKALVWD